MIQTRSLTFRIENLICTGKYCFYFEVRINPSQFGQNVFNNFLGSYKTHGIIS